MRFVSSVLVSCLLVSVLADNGLNIASFLGKPLQAVGSKTVEVAKSVGDGIQSGQPIAAAKSIKDASGVAGAAKTIGHGVQKEVQTAKDPIDKTITFVGSSQCKQVQEIFKVSYEQVHGDNEPDLNNLKIVYQTQDSKTIINITAVPESLRQARKFDGDDSLVLFLHGFTDDPSQKGFSTVSQAYIDRGRVSVLALDASSLIRWFYIRSSTYVRFIGEKLGAVLAALLEQGQNPDRIHIVGHSLGSHIGAFACKQFEQLTGRKIGRMMGLDPAGPCFSNLDPELRLKSTDATFVDVIHTDGGVYGLREPCGDKDFYPNSGSEQPNCLLQTCSHSRVWQLYSESVTNPDAFPAVLCKDWAAFKKGDCDRDTISYMGYPSKPGNNGQYFLQTGGEYPFGLGLNGTKYKNNEGVLKNIVAG